MFKSQNEARQFFIEQVAQRALVEGASLSGDERQMLLWSESEPDSVSDPALPERFAAGTSDADYEARVAGLLKRCFDDEVRRNPKAREQWQQAWSVLNQGDHYLLIILDRALGGRLKPWWRFW